MTDTLSAKKELFKLADRLADDATWDDVLYEIYATQAIEEGIADCDAGRKVPISEVRKRLGLPA